MKSLFGVHIDDVIDAVEKSQGKHVFNPSVSSRVRTIKNHCKNKLLKTKKSSGKSDDNVQN